MGSAYLALEGSSSQLVVVKRLRAELLGQTQIFQRFLHEAEVASHVRHPHVAELIAMGTVDREPFLALEFVFGVAVGQVVQRVEQEDISPVPAPVLMRLALDLAAGLRAIHEATHRQTRTPLQLIHRDIGGRNVLLGSDGRLKIIDLGLGRSVLSAWQTAVHQVSGSPDYMAPEQAVGESADASSDVFAAAATLWELARGRKRITAPTVAERLEQAALSEPVRLGAARPDLPPAFDHALLKAMQNDRAQRTSTAQGFELHLQHAVKSLRPASHSEVAEWLDRTCATALAKGRRQIQTAMSRSGAGSEAATAEYFFGSERVREKKPLPTLPTPKAPRDRRRALVGAAAGFFTVLGGFGWRAGFWGGSAHRETLAPSFRSESPALLAPPSPPEGTPSQAASTSTGAEPVRATEEPRPAPPRPPRRSANPDRLRPRKQALARRLQTLRRRRTNGAFQKKLTRLGRSVTRARTDAQLDGLEEQIQSWEEALR